MIALDYSNTTQLADLVREDEKNLGFDQSFETAVLISLFTHRRALPDDVLPEPLGNRAGWWADPYSDVENELIGSRLWLLGRSKASQETANTARVYAEEALQWMVEEKIATKIETEVEVQGELLALRVKIYKPTNPITRWVGTWDIHLDEL